MIDFNDQAEELSIVMDPQQTRELGARIKVVGAGGGGGNAINTMIASGVEHVDFIAANTDCQALDKSLAPVKIQLGMELTRGLGAGGKPEIGRKAAEESKDDIAECLDGADMVFIAAGEGGGTGTGAAPVIAKTAMDMGCLTVGIVTKPFNFEMTRRKKQAEAGIEELRRNVDSLITIPNQKLISTSGPCPTLKESFKMVDYVLLNAVQSISDIINKPGMINVDFADVTSIMRSSGMAIMGVGRANGADRALEAARQAISSPLLEDTSITGATGILINFTAGRDLTPIELEVATQLISDMADDDVNLIFGVLDDEKMDDDLQLTVIATGFADHMEDTVHYKSARPSIDFHDPLPKSVVDIHREFRRGQRTEVEMINSNKSLVNPSGFGQSRFLNRRVISDDEAEFPVNGY